MEMWTLIAEIFEHEIKANWCQSSYSGWYWVVLVKFNCCKTSNYQQQKLFGIEQLYEHIIMIYDH